jgi:cytochrome c556
MKLLKLISIFIAVSTPLLVTAVEHPEDVEPTILKHIMHGMLSDTHQLTQGIFYNDFKQIEHAAKRIAKHPTPSLSTKIKILSNLGSDMSKFKDLDMFVHDTAMNINKAAKQKNMSDTITEYHKLIDGCLSCHRDYQQSVSKILGDN